MCAIWQNNGDGTITVTQIADIDSAGNVVHTYKPPLLFSEMDRLASGALFARSIVLPDGNQPLFFRTETFASAAGLYGGGLVAEDVPKIGVILDLREDGSLEVIAAPLDGTTLPTAALGVWEQTELTVTLRLSSELGIEDGKPVVRAAAPRDPEVLVLEGGQLVGPQITFLRMPVRTENDEAAPSAGMTSENEVGPGLEPEVPAARNAPDAAEDVTYMVGREQLVAGMTVVLALNSDHSASMSTQLGADAVTLLELGSWKVDPDGLVVVELDRSAYDSVPYATPNRLVFEQTDKRTLTSVDHDPERYGNELVLYDTRDY